MEGSSNCGTGRSSRSRAMLLHPDWMLAGRKCATCVGGLGVPVETIRNWEQGKRMPRGPARALLAVIAHAPETVFAALAKT